MTVPVWVEQKNGHYVANLVGAAGIMAEGETEGDAVAALRTRVNAHVAAGNLRFIDWPPGSTVPAAPATNWPPSAEDEEYHQEFIAEIYRQRDEEKRREFGE